MSDKSSSPTLVLSLNVTDGRKAIDFYRNAFGAELVREAFADDGSLVHCEMRVGDSRLMFSSELPEIGAVSAKTAGFSPTLQCIYTDEVDALYERAVAAGAEVLMPLDNHFWGERAATLRDPDGYRWCVTQHIEDVSTEELLRRVKEYMG